MFTFFAFFIHLVPPCGLIWTHFSAQQFKPILLPCQLAQFCYPAVKANFESKQYLFTSQLQRLLRWILEPVYYPAIKANFESKQYLFTSQLQRL